MQQQQYYYPSYYSMPQQYQQQLPMQNIQSPREDRYGFISVTNEQQAKDWPIAPGNSLTFKDESAPYIYTKTMGLSQFETPVFEKYRLIKENSPEQLKATQENERIFNTVQQYNKDNKEMIDVLENELTSVREEFNTMQQSYQTLKEELNDIKHWLQQPLKESKSTNKKDKEG